MEISVENLLAGIGAQRVEQNKVALNQLVCKCFFVYF